MYNFFEMSLLLELKATVDTLWKYLHEIEKNPNIDDLKTLLNMMQTTLSDEDFSGMLADFLGPINHDIIPKLPPYEQQEAKEAIKKLQFGNPNTNLYMQMKGKKFNDVQELEDFIINGLNSYFASDVARVVKKPENRYLWEFVPQNIKKLLLNKLKKESTNQNFAEYIGKILKDLFQNGPIDPN